MPQGPEATRIRSSSLPGFADCPRRWAASAITEEIKSAGFEIRDSTLGIGAAVGISVHKAASVILDEKAASGALPPRSVATDAAVDTVKEEIAKGVQFDERITPSAGDAHLQVARIASIYHGVVAPKISPIIVETRLEGSVDWADNNLVISGQPDVVAREPNSVVDTKAGSRLGAYQSQLGSYALLSRTNNIGDVQSARIDWIPRVSMKKPQADPVERHYVVANAEQMAANIIAHIDASLTTFRRGDPSRNLLPGDPSAFLSNPGSILCGSWWCRAHSCGSNGWCTDYEPENRK